MGLLESELEELIRQGVPETTVVLVYMLARSTRHHPHHNILTLGFATSSDPSPAVTYTYHSKCHKKNQDNNTTNISF